MQIAPPQSPSSQNQLQRRCPHRGEQCYISSDPADPGLGFAPKLPRLGDEIDYNKEAPKRCLHEGYDAKSATIDWSQDLGFSLDTVLCARRPSHEVQRRHGFNHQQRTWWRGQERRPCQPRVHAATTEYKAAALGSTLHRRSLEGCRSTRRSHPACRHARHRSAGVLSLASRPHAACTGQGESPPPPAVIRLFLAALHGDVEGGGGPCLERSLYIYPLLGCMVSPSQPSLYSTPYRFTLADLVTICLLSHQIQYLCLLGTFRN
jgi:hypothetical protein